AVPRRPLRAAARRAGRDGRRRDGRGLRESVAARAALVLPGLDRMSVLRTAEVIAVGSELLGWTRLDTNSLFIADQLSRLGIELKAKTVVGDDRAWIEEIFRRALGRVDLVVITGGLGPTDDDLTREAVAGALGLELAVDEAIA